MAESATEDFDSHRHTARYVEDSRISDNWRQLPFINQIIQKSPQRESTHQTPDEPSHTNIQSANAEDR